jgi:hypothetical protein
MADNSLTTVIIFKAIDKSLLFSLLNVHEGLVVIGAPYSLIKVKLTKQSLILVQRFL